MIAFTWFPSVILHWVGTSALGGSPLGDLVCLSPPLFPLGVHHFSVFLAFSSESPRDSQVLYQHRVNDLLMSLSDFVHYPSYYSHYHVEVLVSTSPLLGISSSGDDDIPSHICTSCWHKRHLKSSRGIDSLAWGVNSKAIHAIWLPRSHLRGWSGMAWVAPGFSLCRGLIHTATKEFHH